MPVVLHANSWTDGSNWAGTGTSPYIDAQDGDYVECSTKNATSNKVTFDTSGDLGTITSVIFSVYGYSDDGKGDIQIAYSNNDGSSYYGSDNLLNFPNTWSLQSGADQVSNFGTWTLINDAAVTLTNTTTSVVRADHVYITVGYTEGDLEIDVSDGIGAASSTGGQEEAGHSTVADLIKALEVLTSKMSDLEVSKASLVAVADSVTRVFEEPFEESVADLIRVLDQISAVVGDLNTSTVSSVAIADAISMLRDSHTLSPSDAVKVLDSLAGQMSDLILMMKDWLYYGTSPPDPVDYDGDPVWYPSDPLERIRVADAVTIGGMNWGKSVQDLSSVLDSVTVSLPSEGWSKSVSDLINVVDSATLTISSLNSIVTSLIAVADAVTAQIEAGHTLTTDGVKVADAVTSEMEGGKTSVSDLTGVIESALLSLESGHASIQDVIHVISSVTSQMSGLYNSPSDLVRVIDEVTMGFEGVFQKSVYSRIRVSDAVTSQMSDLYNSVTDLVKVADVVSSKMGDLLKSLVSKVVLADIISSEMSSLTGDVYDKVSVLDSIEMGFEAGLFEKSVADLATVASYVVSVMSGGSLSAEDKATVVDSVVSQMEGLHSSMSDLSSVLDSVTVQTEGLHRSMLSLITTASVVSAITSDLNSSQSDLIALAEYVVLNIAAPGEYSVSDLVNIIDYVTLIFETILGGPIATFEAKGETWDHKSGEITYDFIAEGINTDYGV